MVSPPTLYICFQLFQRLQTIWQYVHISKGTLLFQNQHIWFYSKCAKSAIPPILHLELEQVSLFEGVAQQPRL